MRYVKYCLALLLALTVTVTLFRPATTMAKYVGEASAATSFTLDTAQTTYTIDNLVTYGDLADAVTTDHQNIDGYQTEDGKRYEIGYHWHQAESGGEYYNETLAGQGVHIWDKDPLDNYNCWWFVDLGGWHPAGHQIYVRTKLKIVSNNTTPVTFRLSYMPTNVAEAKYSNGNWSLFSAILTSTESNRYLRIGGGQNASYFEYYLSHLMVIDLTETFGKGNEPPQWWCDKYIPWQDETTSGTKTVQWFPKASMSALDTAFHNDSTTGYYAVSDRKNVATVDANGQVTLSGTDTDVNSTSLGNP